VIEVRDLVVRFGDRTVLGGLSFTVAPGELLCVLGASGSGKTTLLRVIGGLLRPTSGDVRVAGEPAEAAWPRCAYVFQAPRLVPWRTALGNVRLAQELRTGHANGEARRYLEMVGLRDLAGQYPSMLSGGERQRVALARALVVEPEVILMDEPFSALDPTTRSRLREELLRIWREQRRTIVFVTHDASEADALATRQLVLEKR
jgi:NitT/TauT family transport system ATP-binding protein